MANDFYVELFDRDYAEAPVNVLKLTVQRYSGNAIGGYEQAEVAVDGPKEALWDALRWLRYYVVIKNINRSRVWAGFITQANINLGGLQVGKSLDEMANRVAVAYSYDDITGKSSRGTTDWADDLDSQSKYGIKELLQSEGDMELDQAEQQRDKALDTTNGISRPISLLDIVPDGGDAPSATLTLKGLWSTLGWQLYNQPGGVERYDTSGNFEHILGWGLSSNTIAFESSQNRIHDISGRFKELRKDDQIVVSGAATGGNNGTFSIAQAASIVDETATNTHVVYTHATIGFDATDDITDNLSGLGFVQAYELIKVSGSTVSGNNRYYFAKSDLAPGHITVTPTTVTTSIASPSITVTIEQGHSIQVNASLGTEYPANTILIEALGKKIAQSFTLSVDLPFTVAEVYIRARVVGAPSDNFTIAIHADSAGSPGSSLETISIAGSTVTEEMNWVKFTFSNTLTLSYATTYHLVVSRSGSNTVTDFYMIDMNEDAEYTGGTMKLWDGSAWVARAWGDDLKTADMPFQVWGHQQTTDQISSILTAGGQFFDTIDIQDASAIASRQYRDQDQTAQVEVENLMKAGIYNSRRMVSSVTPDRVVHVFQEPAYNVDTSPLLGDDGVLRDSSGGPWEPGRLPHGKWVTLSGIPTNVDDFVGISPVFIERAEYDCESGKFSALEPKGAPNPWDVVKLI